MSGWQLAGDAPAAYSRFNVKIMEPWTDDLIRSANCRDGDRVLDVACGTGVVSNRISLVTTKHCSITGIDVNEGMLNVARRNPQMTWHLGSATELPFEADSFEVVICQQGLQYFPDRPTAMREMARVLVPNGRLALNVWGALDRQPGLLAIVETVGEFLGQDSQAALAMAYSLNTRQELHRLAGDTKLRNVHVRFEHRTMRYPNAADYVAGFMGATPVTAQFLAQSEDRQRAFIARAAEQLSTYMDDAGLAITWENHFLTAIK